MKTVNVLGEEVDFTNSSTPTPHPEKKKINKPHYKTMFESKTKDNERIMYQVHLLIWLGLIGWGLFLGMLGYIIIK